MDTVIPVLLASTFASRNGGTAVSLLANESAGTIRVSVAISLTFFETALSITASVVIEENVGSWGLNAVVPGSLSLFLSPSLSHSFLP